MRQQLRAVPGVSVPEVRQAVGSDQVHHRIGVAETNTKSLKVRHLLRRRQGLGLKGGLFRFEHQAATEALGDFFA